MSSKFFTWTKGDRRNASSELSLFPVSVSQGTDDAGIAKGLNKSHRPAPLALHSKSTSPNLSSRTTNSFALHEAAVKSATSLLTVMNDMLSSPYLPSHLKSIQPYAAGSSSLSLRPRAYTAPSTPLVEAPPMGFVELPGSLPEDRKQYLSFAQSRYHGIEVLPSLAAIGEKIERPRTSPQEFNHALPNRRGRMSVESFYRDEMFSVQKQTSPRSRSCSPRHRLDLIPLHRDNEEKSEHADGYSETATIRVPSPFVPPIAPTTSSSIASPVSVNFPQHDRAPSLAEQMQQIDAESSLISQIANMRSSHETHIKSLRDAHEKEIASHQCYIAFLEDRQRRFPPGTSTKGGQTLTLDTCQSSEIGGSESFDLGLLLQTQERSATAQTYTSLDGTARVEALRRKLSLYRKAQEDTAELRRERDQLRNVASGSDRRILQLKEIVRKAKETEKSLRNTIENLEGKLAASNHERVDVLEGFNEASERVRALSERERELIQELEELRQRLQMKAESEVSTPPLPPPKDQPPRHQRTYSDLGAVTGKGHPLMQEMRDLRRMLAEKNDRIRQLEDAGADKSEGAPSARLNRSVDLEQEVENQKQLLAATKADSDRYNSLLHAELRRQARLTAEKKATRTTMGESGAATVIAEKMARLRARSETLPLNATADGSAHSGKQGEYSIALLEAELEHCISETIGYKSNIRRLRKELKSADAKIDSLQVQAMSTPRPPTPEKSPVSVRSHSSAETEVTSASERPAEPLQPGLGISMSAKLVSCGTPEKAHVVAIPPATQKEPITSLPIVPSRTKTPLGMHKKLPKPPPSSTQHTHALRVLDVAPQADTLRSFSESVLSSYAMAEQRSVARMKEAPHSAPLGTVQSPVPAAVAPFSKFALNPTPKIGQNL